MSCYNRIQGNITLPASEVADVKRHVRETHNRFVEKVYDEAKAWWKANKTQSVERYQRNVDATMRRMHDSSRTFRVTDQVVFARALQEVLTRIVWQASRGGSNLRGVTWADMDSAGLGRATNRTFQFVQGEGKIIFDGRKLRVYVYENNRAVEAWEQHPATIALLRALDRVNWTRNSGGRIMYDDEYQRDAMSGPSEYLSFGPKADQARRMFAPSSGNSW